MSAERWRSMAQRMLNGRGGSTVTWTRRTLTSNGPAGTVAVDASQDYPVRVAQLDAKSSSLFGAEAWQTATVRLAMAALDLPFDPESHSGSPEIRFDDTVEWLGVDMRVLFVQAWAAPGGPGLPPQPCVYFVGLGA